MIGSELAPFESRVDAARQRRYHAAAGVATELFGGHVDPSVAANDTILATRSLAVPLGPALHAGQRVTLHEPIRLGETLLLRGRLTALRPATRGSFVTFSFRFERADGSAPLESELSSFAVGFRAEEAAPAADPAAEPPREGFLRAFEHQLTPAGVAAYSRDFAGMRAYAFHFEPEAAAALGLRAPVAQGLMSLTWMTAAVAADGPLRALDLAARFRAPIFWDDRVALERRERWLRVTKADGSVCSTGELLRVEREEGRGT